MCVSGISMGVASRKYDPGHFFTLNGSTLPLWWKIAAGTGDTGKGGTGLQLLLISEMEGAAFPSVLHPTTSVPLSFARAHGRSCRVSPPRAVGEGAARPREGAACLVTQRADRMDGCSYLGTGICSQTCRLGKGGQRMSEVLPRTGEGSRFLLSSQSDPSPSKHQVPLWYVKHQLAAAEGLNAVNGKNKDVFSVQVMNHFSYN